MNELLRFWLISGTIGIVGCLAVLYGLGTTWWPLAMAAMWVPVIAATIAAFARQARR